MPSPASPLRTSRSSHNPWLHRFAVLTAVATLALVGIGGLVTSHEAGMAVPDWPTSYGYNMFLFPFARWWHGGNVFYEHSHRLFASGVGLLTTILAVWLWLKESRAWLRWLGFVAFLAVVLQGVLGGLRVVLIKDQIGIFHATLAQMFFALTCALALFTSRSWRRMADTSGAGRPQPAADDVLKRPHSAGGLRRWFIGATVLILFQLILGATMRHQHAGLAIPDFPLAYGRVWPATDAVSIARYNQQHSELTTLNPINAFQIILQMAHRIVAVLILAAVAFSAWRARVWSSGIPVPAVAADSDAAGIELQRRMVVRLAFAWLGLIVAQVALGAATILSDKAADVATAHVLVGTLSLATGAMLCIVISRSPEPVRNGAVLPASEADMRVDGDCLATGTACAP